MKSLVGIEGDKRRYQHNETGIIYRISMQARSPTGRCELCAADHMDSREIATTNDRLSIDFTRVDAGAPVDRIPTPAELLAAVKVDHEPAIKAGVAEIVRQLREKPTATAATQGLRPVVDEIARRMREAKWETEVSPFGVVADTQTLNFALTVKAPVTRAT